MCHSGSEQQRSSEAEGDRLREARAINQSLSALGHVIHSLVERQNGERFHVPFRNSKLTYMLQVSVLQAHDFV